MGAVVGGVGLLLLLVGGLLVWRSRTKVAAAKARSQELREAVELGQRKTLATRAREAAGAHSEQAELARQAWLAKKNKQAQAQRRGERARLVAQEEWEAAHHQAGSPGPTIPLR